MSKPKPGLGKGIARTLTHHTYTPSTPASAATASVSTTGGSSSSSSSLSSSSVALSSSLPSSASSTSTPSLTPTVAPPLPASAPSVSQPGPHPPSTSTSSTSTLTSPQTSLLTSAPIGTQSNQGYPPYRSTSVYASFSPSPTSTPSSNPSIVVTHHPLALGPVFGPAPPPPSLPLPPSFPLPSHADTASGSSAAGSLNTSAASNAARTLTPLDISQISPAYLALLPLWDPPATSSLSSATGPSTSTTTTASLPHLTPTWVDNVVALRSDAASIIIPYRPRRNSRPHRLFSSAPISISGSTPLLASLRGVIPSTLSATSAVPGLATAVASSSHRTYTSSTGPLRAAVETAAAASSYPFISSFLSGPSLPPSLLFERPPTQPSFSFPGYTPPKTSPPPPPSSSNLGDFFTPPPPPPSPEPPQHAPQIKQPRPSESHTVLSPAPLTTTGSTSQGGPTPSPSPPIPYLTSVDRSDPLIGAPGAAPETASVALYSSTLVFHTGASGAAKERTPLPPPRPGRERPPTPPPRPRSFPLPDVTAPAVLRSTGIGEDAYTTRADGMCIADGVGGWARSGRGGADASRWSQLLTHFCEEEVGRWWAGAEAYVTASAGGGGGVGGAGSAGNVQEEGGGGVGAWARRAFKRSVAATKSDDSVGLEPGKSRRPLDPVEIMQRAYEKCLACVTAEQLHGSSTCLLALLHHSTLLIANLGDCCLLVVRRGKVELRTSEMHHAFNFPVQLGTHSRDEPMKDAVPYRLEIERGDIVVVGSDGLMDNLFDEEILEVLAEFAAPSTSDPTSHLPTPPSTPSSSLNTSLPPFSPQLVSEALCHRARAVSEQSTATTPFMMRAIEEGIEFVGGKKDDISVLVGVIGDREAGDGMGMGMGGGVGVAKG